MKTFLFNWPFYLKFFSNSRSWDPGNDLFSFPIHKDPNYRETWDVISIQHFLMKRTGPTAYSKSEPCHSAKAQHLFIEIIYNKYVGFFRIHSSLTLMCKWKFIYI